MKNIVCVGIRINLLHGVLPFFFFFFLVAARVSTFGVLNISIDTPY